MDGKVGQDVTPFFVIPFFFIARSSSRFAADSRSAVMNYVDHVVDDLRHFLGDPHWVAR